MSLVALTVTHRTASLAELERVAVPTVALGEALAAVAAGSEVREAVLLSTCNRVEVYASTGDPERAVEWLRAVLEDVRGLSDGWVLPRSRVVRGDDAVRHLFLVAAGLDSMILGEPEVLGQVREAYKAAAACGVVGPTLHPLFRSALQAGSRARTATGLARAGRSLPHAAARAVAEETGGLAGRTVLVVGTGKVAASCLGAVVKEGALPCLIGRRPHAAESLAARVEAAVLPLPALEEALAAVDGAIFATAAPSPLVSTEALARALASRGGRPLVVVDLGVPRNVDPVAAGLVRRGPGALALYDLEGLDRAGFTGLGGWEAEINRATQIVLAEADRCIAWFRSRPADSFAAAVHVTAARVAEAEAARVLARLPGLDQRQRLEVAWAIRRAIRKIVHLPTARAREAASRGDLDLVDAARWLFGVEAAEEQAAGSASPMSAESVGGR